MRSRVSNRIAIGGLAALACLFAAASVARADDYPSRVVTLVVPYPPGGGVDAMARVVAQKLSDAFHQQVIVDNKAGAGGTLGTRAVAHAAPDGYTLLLGHTGTISINPSLYVNAGFDPRKDFTAIGLIASMPVVLLAHPSFPAKTVADVIALAKKEHGNLNIGTSAVGTGGYMAAEYFKSAANLDVTLIPYKGTAPALTDLLALLVNHEVPLDEAVELACTAAGSKRLAASGRELAERIRRGQVGGPPPAGFPPLLAWTIATGGKQPNLPQMLHRTAQTYRDEFQRRYRWIEFYVPVVATALVAGGIVAIYAVLSLGPWIVVMHRLADPLTK